MLFVKHVKDGHWENDPQAAHGAGVHAAGFAERLGISTSYLNLVEHDQRNVTASLLFKLTDILKVDLAALSGVQERELEVALREVFADPLLGAEPVPEAEIRALAAAPNGARAILALHRAWAGAREDADGITLPSGRRILLPNEEVRDFFHAHENHFESLEDGGGGDWGDAECRRAWHQPCAGGAVAAPAWAGGERAQVAG